jgi:hypothetical protein
MNFDELVKTIEQVSAVFKQSANTSINIHVTVRNWLTGLYIVEFEQNGENRAEYGAKLLKKLADRLDTNGLSLTNLKLFRQFYTAYPQIGVIFTSKHFPTIRGCLKSPVIAGLTRNLLQIVNAKLLVINH